MCRVDFYEVQDAKDCGEFVTVKINIGSLCIKSEKARIKKSKS